MDNIKENTLAILKQLNVEYDYYEHEPLFTMEAAEVLDKKLGIEMCKNLFLSTKHSTEFYLLLMPGSKKFKTGEVSKQISVPRMSFGKSEDMEKYLKIKPGSVSPLGLLNDSNLQVNFLIDKDVLLMERISIHPCVNTSTIVIKTEDLINKILPFCNHKYRVVEVKNEC